MNNVNLFQYSNIDLNFYHCGEEECTPKHAFGPAIRDHYLIHYVLKGKGTYKVNNKSYHLSKGQGFLIWPNEITYYQADEKEPWHYVWIGFQGVKAKEYLKKAHLDKENLIFTYHKDDFLEKYIKQILKENHLKKSKDLNTLGYLYLCLGKIIENSSESEDKKNGEQKNNYVNEAVKYIQAYYWRNITIQDVSAYLSINRSYLYTLFKEQLSISPQQFLIQFRMKKALELMKNNDLTISQIARSVGYDDPLMFSKAFKKIYNISPKFYRVK